MSSRVLPLSPIVQPVYTDLAVIIECQRLRQLTGLRYSELAKAAFHHTNTVTSKFKGDRGQYSIVHDCFSAVNRLTGNTYRRREYIRYIDDNEAEHDDSALDDCLVFPRLRKLVVQPPFKDYRTIGDVCGVQTMYIEHMRLGRPVAKNLANAFFVEFAKLGAAAGITLAVNDELFQ